LPDAEGKIAARRQVTNKLRAQYRGHRRQTRGKSLDRVVATTGMGQFQRINQVERWFAELTRQLIERGEHRNVHTLEKTSAPGSPTGIPTQNPFVWTKTAEQILQSI
jgi:hypothetical protein